MVVILMLSSRRRDKLTGGWKDVEGKGWKESRRLAEMDLKINKTMEDKI
jgi:hypothetical protein